MAVTLSIAGNARIDYVKHGSIRTSRTADGSQGMLDVTLINPPTIPAVENTIVLLDGSTTVYDGAVKVVNLDEVKDTVYVGLSCQDNATEMVGVPGDAAYDLSDTPNYSTTYDWQKLTMQTRTVEGEVKTTLVAVVNQPGLEVNTNILVTSANYGLSAVEYTIQRIDTEWFTEAAPIFTITMGDPLVHLALVVRDIPDGSITSTKISDGAIVTPKLGAGAVTADNIAAQAITAEKLAAELILASTIKTADTGRRIEIEGAGITAYDADGSLLVKIPTADEPVYVKGEVEASALTSNDSAEFRNAASLAAGAVMTVETGFTTPSSPPTLTAVLDKLLLTSTPPNNGSGICYDSAGGPGGATATFWLGADPSVSSYVAHEYNASTGALIRSITKTGSITTYTTSLGSMSHVSDTAVGYVGSAESQIATPLTMPRDGVITKVSVYAAGRLGTVSLKNAIWNTSGTLLAESAAYTAASGGATSPGASSQYNKVLTSFLSVSSGTTIWAGFLRTGTGDGSQHDRDDGAGNTQKRGDGNDGNMTGISTDTTTKPNVYITYNYDVDTTLEGTMGKIVGVARQGTYIWVLDSNGMLFRYVQSTMAWVDKFDLSAYIATPANAGLFWDGSFLVITTATGTTGTDQVRFVYVTTAGAYSSVLSTTGYSINGAAHTVRGGRWDSSGWCYWVVINDGVYAYDGTTGAHIANRWFGSSATVVDGITHDGSVFRGFAAATPTRIWYFTNWDWTTESNVYWVGYAWYDSVGTTHETALGPRASVTMRRREVIQVFTTTIPGSGGTDQPDQVRVYMERNATEPAAGTYHLQATDSATVHYLETFATGGAADGGGTAFPSGGVAELKSATTGWSLTGDGVADIPNLTGGVGATYNLQGGSTATTLTTATTYYFVTGHEVSFTPSYVGQKILVVFNTFPQVNTTTAQYLLERVDVTDSSDTQIAILGYIGGRTTTTANVCEAVSGVSVIWTADAVATRKIRVYATVGASNSVTLTNNYSTITVWSLP